MHSERIPVYLLARFRIWKDRFKSLKAEIRVACFRELAASALSSMLRSHPVHKMRKSAVSVSGDLAGSNSSLMPSLGPSVQDERLHENFPSYAAVDTSDMCISARVWVVPAKNNG